MNENKNVRRAEAQPSRRDTDVGSPYEKSLCPVVLRPYLLQLAARPVRNGRAAKPGARASFGWHYLSNATCLMRPRLFSSALLV